ncbi:S41 family peptidase [Anaerotignum lactatifermentans]|uniref:Carboxyl-terminal processing protease n=1 Tax=Anaerotignum lactatifermentans DSM 14214 TaxID=1121323 RepID=A0A1M6SCQ1_9FIRM|nr:S41 family peptidase [Anaerotignum lactatifermentans]SHK42288.1 carboxyl-terminal processing protease [[Clostridium] lactatifermentans DSM 14214] [Anaerotignum lactatifermentans DSM 14214]
MQKKDFWKGFGAAFVLLAVIYFGGQFLAQMNIALPFGMSNTAKIRQIEEMLDTYYVEDYDKELAEELMYTGLVAGVGDPYTYYLSADSLAEQVEKNSGHFVGIGVEIYAGDDGYIVVSSVTPGGPAEAAGILAEDKITEVDGESITGKTAADVSALVKGEEGTDVTLTIFRESTGEVLEKTVTRQDIQVQTVSWCMMDDNIGYISITNFRENTYNQFKEALDTLEAEGMEKLVLDLRNNTGGLVKSAHEIGEELLPEGIMVYTMDKEGNREDTLCDDVYNDVPMVVLVNGNSASAAEILAGAIQDTGRGELIGTTTFGKGLVQRLFTLPDGSGLNVTIQKYYTPNGTSIHGVGITPDYEVELPEEYAQQTNIPAEADTQLQKAVEVLSEKNI